MLGSCVTGATLKCSFAIITVVILCTLAAIFDGSPYRQTRCKVIGVEVENRTFGDAISYNPLWVVNYTVQTWFEAPRDLTGRIVVINQRQDGSYEDEKQATLRAALHPLESVALCVYRRDREKHVRWWVYRPMGPMW